VLPYLVQIAVTYTTLASLFSRKLYYFNWPFPFPSLVDPHSIKLYQLSWPPFLQIIPIELDLKYREAILYIEKLFHIKNRGVIQPYLTPMLVGYTVLANLNYSNLFQLCWLSYS